MIGESVFFIFKKVDKNLHISEFLTTFAAESHDIPLIQHFTLIILRTMQNLQKNNGVVTTSQYTIDSKNKMKDNMTVTGLSYGCVVISCIGSEFWTD